VDRMAADLGCAVADLMRSPALREKIRLEQYVSESVGLPPLTDILAELAKPGRDPRAEFEQFAFAEGVTRLEDLLPGMRLPGGVTNVTAFGAFVDIGVHQDGLVHVSQLADRFVKDPAEVVRVHQKVQVLVLEVDLQRRRIGLSLRSNPEAGGGRTPRTGPAEARPRPAKPSPGASRTPPPPANNWFALAMEKARQTGDRKR